MNFYPIEIGDIVLIGPKKPILVTVIGIRYAGIGLPSILVGKPINNNKKYDFAKILFSNYAVKAKVKFKESNKS